MSLFSKKKELVVTDSDAGNMLATIQNAALNPDVDVDKMKALLDMQERIIDKNAAVAFNHSMMKVQREMKSIPKTAWNAQTKSNYAKAEEIDKVLTPLYTSHGFCLMFGTADSPHEYYIRITCDVGHEQGHVKPFFYDLPPDEAGIKGTVNKTKVHASASTLKYGQRYLKSMIFNITFGKDTDGNPPDSEPVITEEQGANIQALIDEVGEDGRKALYNWLKIDSIDQVPVKQYDKAVRALEKRRI